MFIHIPKCAGTSIELALGHFDENCKIRSRQDHRSVRHIQNPNIFNLFKSNNLKYFIRNQKKKIFPSRFRNNNIQLNKKQYETYFKFTIVRNPWARVYSAYKNIMFDDLHKQKRKINDSLNFNEYVKRFVYRDPLLVPAIEYIKDYHGNIDLDFIGRFENLNSDFQKICDLANFGHIKLPHKLKSSKDDFYKDFYNKCSVNLVAEVFSEDIKTFNYKY